MVKNPQSMVGDAGSIFGWGTKPTCCGVTKPTHHTIESTWAEKTHTTKKDPAGATTKT